MLLGDSGLHEDIIADAKVVYLALFRASRVEAGKEEPLLNSIVAHTTRTRARSEARHTAQLASVDGTLATMGTADERLLPDRSLERKQELLALRRALDRLSERDRRIVTIWFLEGVQAVAQAERVSAERARVWIHRARVTRPPILGHIVTTLM